MKQFKKLLLVTVFMLGAVGVANAQKIGHIDSAKLIENMPATKKAKSEIEKIKKTYSDEIIAQIKNYEDKLQRYIAEDGSQSQTTRQLRNREIQQDNERIKRAQQTAEQELKKKYEELMNPVYEKAKKAIKDVAAAKGLIYIFNSSPGGGLIVFEKGEDIYEAVKTKLGF